MLWNAWNRHTQILLLPHWVLWFYAAVGVSDSQKGDNFRVIDHVFDGPFNNTAVSQY